ncbi:hypothetical protein [Clostridium frigidicarnis]|uniref:Peptidase family S41 n=1 Tax=Clostridium frigidicarnis TaxID=84698 RepID=A0A1I0Z7Q9_9CLOT|nr:hypothetical protein [Clostridium frigidicarnis]SFB21442.1 hypothetical protein SAMN04488528_101815 [Clostridium frigidicarnis]
MNIFVDLNEENLKLIDIKSSINEYFNYCNLVSSINENLCLDDLEENELDYKKFISKSEALEDLNIFFNILDKTYRENNKFGGEQVFECIKKNLLYEFENIETITCWDLEQLINRQFRFIDDESIKLNDLRGHDENICYDIKENINIPIINMRNNIDETKNITELLSNPIIIVDLRGYGKYIMDNKFYYILDCLYSIKDNKVFMLIDNNTKGLGEALIFISKHIKNVFTVGVNTASMNERGIFEFYKLPNSNIILTIKVKSFYDILNEKCEKGIFVPNVLCDPNHALKTVEDMLFQNVK